MASRRGRRRAFLLQVESARLYGLVTFDAHVNLTRCRDLLERARKLGITPAEIV